MSKSAGTSSAPKSTSSSVDARGLAARVLVRVWQDGAFASPALNAELARHPQLAGRDAALATELTYGVLRTQRWLEQAIAEHSRGDRWLGQPQLRAHLLLAAYQLVFLRVPDHAAVSEAVRAVKARHDRRVAGFANAVLRKLAAAPPTASLAEARIAALPPWLKAELDAAIGDAALVLGDPPPLSLCLRQGEDRDAWIAQLQSHDREARAGELSPRAIITSGDPAKLPGYNQAWLAQEEGAQVLALALGAGPDDVVLDACAGRGGKTLLLVDSGATVDAADKHPKKLERLRGAPWGRQVRNTHAVDWTRGVGDVPSGYDRVLVDAPCTGSGTLRRRPEIALKLAASDPTRMAALQLEITRRAATRLRPGGTLVYAVCSVLREECEGVVAALLADDTLGLTEAPFTAGPTFIQGEASFRLLPGTHGTDAYFAACLRAPDS